MRFLPIAAALAGLGLLPVNASADCSCLCIDGAYRPVCTAAEEVGANRGLCHALSSQSCPVAPAAELESYAPAQEGVDNCRETQVFDATSNEFLTAKVCDVMPEV